mmetsp:Transcript_17219/g.51025  ORF Transcript_17219/g.51025 Transcript_17219/m.51025 type:complete len:205 (-) Transcript_17219:71-685(-)
MTAIYACVEGVHMVVPRGRHFSLYCGPGPVRSRFLRLARLALRPRARSPGGAHLLLSDVVGVEAQRHLARLGLVARLVRNLHEPARLLLLPHVLHERRAALALSHRLCHQRGRRLGPLGALPRELRLARRLVVERRPLERGGGARLCVGALARLSRLLLEVPRAQVVVLLVGQRRRVEVLHVGREVLLEVALRARLLRHALDLR